MLLRRFDKIRCGRFLSQVRIPPRSKGETNGVMSRVMDLEFGARFA